MKEASEAVYFTIWRNEQLGSRHSLSKINDPGAEPIELILPPYTSVTVILMKTYQYAVRCTATLCGGLQTALTEHVPKGFGLVT